MLRTRRGATVACAALIGVVALSACSSGGSKAATSSSSSPSAGTPAAGGTTASAAVKTCPLTGVAPTKSQSVTHPALAVKIDNVAGALPQTGVNGADVVVEELVEGGLTRLMAIFQCQPVSTVGPIRSARISDADILALLHGSILGFSGANPADLPPIEAHSDAVLISQDRSPQYFYRGTEHEAPHNVYSSTSRLMKAGLAERPKLTAPKPLFSYGAIDPAATRAAKISLSWSYATSATWTWASNEWLRTQDGQADKQVNGKQLTADNVIVMSVDIASTGLRDVLGNPSPEDVTVGHNKAWVFRDGKVIRGTWHRKKVTSGIVFKDRTGTVINLTPGRTWVELLPTPAKPSIS